MTFGLVAHGHAAVVFHGPPRPGGGHPLGFVGEGTAWTEDDALVLQGPVAPGARIGRVARLVTWIAGTFVVVVYLARGGRLEEPPSWLVLTCIGLAAAGLAARIVGARVQAVRTERFPWYAVRAALPMGLAMHLVTARGEAVLLGLGPAGGQQLQQLGEAIVRRAAGQPFAPPARSAAVPGKWVALGGVLIGAGLVTWCTWMVLHRALYVDNATGEPVDLWVDGARVQTIPPNDDGLHPTKLFVRAGQHTIGSSRVGATTATEQRIDFVGEVLLNPDGRACYWRTVVEYGDANARAYPVEPGGPLPIQTVYDMRGVTDWFRDTPGRIELRNGARWGVRVAVTRNGVCTELGAQRCDGARTQLVKCEAAAKSETQIQACEEAATAQCDEGEAQRGAQLDSKP
jgi:hypothetical protein